MTQRTKAELATQISTLLADNSAGDISASDVRSVFTDSKDSLVGGPASATDNTLPRFDSTTGQLLQTSGITVDDSNNVSGVVGLLVTGTTAFNNGAADIDFTIKKNTSGNALVYDAGADTLTLGGALTHDGGVVFNEASADVDFRVESNGNTHALFVDAGNDRVGILNNAPSVALDVTGAVLASTTVTATTNVVATAYFLRSVGTALTAAGTTRADALALTKEINNLTTVASGTGVILPVGQVGMQITVYNNGANAAQVYAAGSETINGTAGSTGVALTNAKVAVYHFVAANTWIGATLN